MIMRPTELRPGTMTVTVGTWPAPAARGSLSDEPRFIISTAARTIRATTIAAAMTIRRRRRERSTTTSVSDE